MSIDAELAAAIALAETEAAARIAAAVAAAQLAANATTQSANIQAEADKIISITTSNAQKAVAVTNKTADVQVAGIEASVNAGLGELNLTGTEFVANRNFDGVQYQQDSETNRLQRTLDFAQDKWNQVFPLIEEFLANPSQGQSSINWNNLVTALGVGPWISQGGVYTPSQIQAQLNALYARSDQKTATEVHDAQIDLAGRGFGGSSPLIDLLRFSYEAANVQSSVEGAQQLALQAAQANTELILNQQKERQDQYANNEQFYAQLQKISVDLSVGVLDSVARIISAVAG